MTTVSHLGPKTTIINEFLSKNGDSAERKRWRRAASAIGVHRNGFNDSLRGGFYNSMGVLSFLGIN